MNTIPQWARAFSVTLLAATTLSSLAIAPVLAQGAPIAPYGNFRPATRLHVHHPHIVYTNVVRRNAVNRGRTKRAAGKRTKAPSQSKVDLETTLNGLKLTDAQKAQENLYQAKADAAGKAAYADRTLSSDQFIARMDKIHDDLMDDIRGILTPGQRSRFDSQMAKEK